MTVRAVVFDIGGVLALIEDRDLSPRWEAEIGLPPGEIGARMAEVWVAGSVGSITGDDVDRELRERLGLSREQVDAMRAETWAEYLGVANTELIDYFRGLRPRFLTGILSNSFVGAREREREVYGFEDYVDDLVYSHEVGMAKPDPRIYALTCERLGVRPQEMVFVDDREDNVAGARDVGIHAVHHRDNPETIAAIEALLTSPPTCPQGHPGGVERP